MFACSKKIKIGFDEITVALVILSNSSVNLFMNLEGREGWTFKKKGASGKNIEFWEGRILEGFIFFII